MEKEGLGLEITELRLGLPAGNPSFSNKKNQKKRVFSEMSGDRKSSTGENKMERKNQVVGWPPVCSYRRKNSFNGIKMTKMYVKVSMDGAPFLRKINLSYHNGYSDLAMALEKLFGCFGIVEALRNADNCEFITIYEDKDGDWMLVGDVPWEMFTESCKRLRIMKRSEEAKGIDIELYAKNSLKGA
ncbi:hypothetical protein ACSBR2_023439 [Camellia fascicularis]